jgi:hypothetical protein
MIASVIASETGFSRVDGLIAPALPDRSFSRIKSAVIAIPNLIPAVSHRDAGGFHLNSEVSPRSEYQTTFQHGQSLAFLSTSLVANKRCRGTRRGGVRLYL